MYLDIDFSSGIHSQYVILGILINWDPTRSENWRFIRKNRDEFESENAFEQRGLVVWGDHVSKGSIKEGA